MIDVWFLMKDSLLFLVLRFVMIFLEGNDILFFYGNILKVIRNWGGWIILVCFFVFINRKCVLFVQSSVFVLKYIVYILCDFLDVEDLRMLRINDDE